MSQNAIKFWRVSAPGIDSDSGFYYRKQDAKGAAARLRRKGGQPIIAEFWLESLRKQDVCYALNNWPKR